jgi:hypothetical protein
VFPRVGYHVDVTWRVAASTPLLPLLQDQTPTLEGFIAEMDADLFWCFQETRRGRLHDVVYGDLETGLYEGEIENRQLYYGWLR